MQFINDHSRLLSGLVAGALAGLALPHALPVPLRAILGWDVTAIVYVSLIILMMGKPGSHETLKRKAAREDQGRWVILAVLVSASFVSLIAIATLLTNTKDLAPQVTRFHLILAAITVIASWMLMHILFAVHYAHQFYGDADIRPQAYERRGGLSFPETKEPVFSDFMYYSFVIGMTCQVSDVQITGRSMRRLAMRHGILAFFFNTIVLALSVNIAASLVS